MGCQRKRHPGQENRGSPLQPRVRGGPSSLGVRAVNSLYRLDATADEGAAGRPEVQEGQAGRSAQSGLATGTENRREMNSVKRGRDGEVKGVGRGGRGGRGEVGTWARWGDSGGWEGWGAGVDTADAAGGQEGEWRQEKSAWLWVR